jgi:predicted component of type VI protein secretion system
VNAFLEGPDGSRIELHDGFVIGRVQGCDLAIGDPKASRRHARLSVVGSVVELEDLDSHNGTLLNGKPVKKRVLRDGDEIAIGTTVLRFHEGHGTAAGPAGQPGELGMPEELELGDAPAPARAPPGVPGPRPSPPPAPAPATRPTAMRPSPAATPNPPGPPAAGEVLEFLDEVVQVRSDQPAKPAAAVGPRPAARGDSGARQGGVLQFQAQRNQRAIKGPLGDDLAQMSIGMRLVWLGIGLALAGGLGWVVMALVQ